MPGLLHMRRSSTRRLEQVVAYLLLLSGTAVIGLPFFWMISTSLKQQMDVYLFPPQWIPQPVQWDNYRQVMTFWPFWTFVWNSFVVTTGAIAGKLIASSVAAYGFARLRAPGRDAIFIILLSTMMLPSQVTLIPQFILFSKLRWIDTFNLNTPAKRTLALALQFFQGSEGVLPQLHLLMAASFLSMLPLLVLFTVAQKHFIQGIVFTGIKG